MPHHPYVFSQTGEYVPGDKGVNDTEAYRDQLIFTNKRILDIVKDLVLNSNRPPIIMIQGDHGVRYSPEERVAILNAIYLPDGGDQWLYPTISPVNTFRVVFNHYFGGEYDLLEDVSYYSSYVDEFGFEIVPPTSSDCLQIGSP